MLEVYDFYDGPRLFTVRNAVGTVYLAFWADQTGTHDHWLYVAVSRIRLQQLKQGDIALRQAFLAAEDGVVFEVSTERQTGKAAAKQVTPQDIEPERLPIAGDVLEEASRKAKSIETIECGVQEVRISNARGRRPLSFSAVTSVLEAWRALFEQLLHNLGSKDTLYPVATRAGSFVIQLAAPDQDIAEDALELLEELIRNTDENNLEQAIRALEVDMSKYESLLAAVSLHKVELEVFTETKSGLKEPRISLQSQQSGDFLRYITHLSQRHLDSELVPQADEVLRVFHLVELIEEKADASSETLSPMMEVVPRQVNYYKQAARILGFLDRNNNITSAGHQIIALKDTPRRLRTAVVQFETSDCGWAWIRWSGAASLVEVDPSTAQDFLVDVVPGLQRVTAARRAKTLRSWYKAMIDYHYENSQGWLFDPTR